MNPLGLSMVFVEQRQAELARSAQSARVSVRPARHPRVRSMPSWLTWGVR